MLEKHLIQIVEELQLQPRQVAATAVLLEEGGTVPFIARYRKERTGGLDEVQIANVRDRIQELEELDKRRESILGSLTERKLLTEELQARIDAAATLATLEDLYLPFRPKKRTRATIAKERGLESLAEILFAQALDTDPEKEAAAFVSAEKEVPDVAAALAGARDIIAEIINDSAEARAALRSLYLNKGVLKSKVVFEKETEAAKFKDYFDWSEPVADCPSHRFLAIRRGESEGLLFSRITPPEEEPLATLDHLFVKGSYPAAAQVRLAAHDCFKRLLGFAMEGEARLFYKKKADEEAIRVFADNLRELLLSSPLGQKSVLALDPGFRTGCKLVALDAQGKLLMHEVVYPEKSPRERAEAAEVIKSVVNRCKIEAIAIGNGTASRETETFVRALGLPPSVMIVVVNEAGASIYSASDVAREEFPDLDLTVRGSISIGRRLMDPLAELVKIDPKSIGVGQYQHDVDQAALKRSLDDTVVSCVNHVGVELNTASTNLLAYVSGLNSRTALNIVQHRNQNGPFKSREELLKVAGLGPKAFEQAAGFLRIRNGLHPLDASAVHPERYPIVDRMAQDLGCSVPELLQNPARRASIKLEKYVTPEVGLPTLQDIVNEIAKPGRDPRKQFEAFAFSDEAVKIQDLKPGMKLPGIVTNVAAFGAFIDVGVHQDGLAHISQLSDQFVKAPSDVVKVGQKVMATVLELDLDRKRISLSLKTNPEIGAAPRGRESGTSGGGGKNFSSARPQQQKSAPQVDWFTAAMNRKN
ncbi:MAG: RNA-binding transcriptional accessory protein [Spartobacteria bacterium Tous-C9RFEB]|nr:MAG: RNA-binding transcriptional accessory protein [Spartobacteria bacterium Tous-C9RFEB]